MAYRRILTLVLFLPAIAFSQPDWLKNAMQASSTEHVDKKASALVLHDASEIVFSKDNKAKNHIRFAVKILAPVGKEYAILHETVAPWRKVNNLEGWLIEADGKTTKLKDKNVSEISDQNASTFYDDDRTLVAYFDDVKSEDVVAYEYDAEEEFLASTYQQFVLQIRQPVLYTQVSATVPDGWSLQKAEWQTDSIRFEKVGNRYVWTGSHLPFRPEEPHMPAWDWLARRIAMTCYNPGETKEVQFKNWGTVCSWTSDLHKASAEPDSGITQRALQLTQNLTTPLEKLGAIASFVRDQVRYVAVEIGKERWQPRKASLTLQNRFGDCKDKVALMRSLLNAVGIPSVSVLANASYSVRPELSTPFQFDHCIIAIPLNALPEPTHFANASSKGWLLYDPTSESTELGNMPYELQGDFVLPAAASDSSLVQVPYEKPNDHLRAYTIDATLKDDGSLAADVTVIDKGSKADDVRYEAKTTPKEKIIQAWKEFLSSALPVRAFSGYEFSNSGDSCISRFHVDAGNVLLPAGNQFLLRLDPLHPSESSPMTAEKRQHPIWMGRASSRQVHVVWHLPPAWHAEISDSVLTAKCSSATASCSAALAGHSISFDAVEENQGAMMPAEKYAEAKTFFRELSNIKSMTVLVSKK